MHTAPSPAHRRSWWRRLAVAITGLAMVAGLVGVTEVVVASGARAGTNGAVSVRDNGAKGDGTGDDTAAFLAAQDAALASTVRYPDGPGGRPQAVVYVPPGTYRLLRLRFRPNVRMEVDAAAVLVQAGGRNVSSNPPPALIVWDGKPGAAVTNVSLVGVNSSSGGLKSQADPVFPGWSLDRSFTFNLDPAATNASQIVSGLMAVNVNGFLVQNVYSIQNDSQPARAPKTDAGWWPQTRRAALNLRERTDTPPNGSVYYDPHNGTVSNWYNIHAPKGYGPNQVNAGHDLTLSHIFSSGGVALRFETDGSQNKTFAAELRNVTAEDIAGRDCNRAVTFAPHSQKNYDVHVTDVTADSCASGVVESLDETNSGAVGRFSDSTIADVRVTGGNGAQNGKPGTDGLWTVGTSIQAFSKDLGTQKIWSVVYQKGSYSCRGPFQSMSAVIMTTDGFQQPSCT